MLNNFKTITADYQPSEVNRPKEFNLQFLNFTVNCSIMIMGKELASDGSTSGSTSGSIAGLASGSINELLDSAINEDIVEETLKSEDAEDEGEDVDLEEIEPEIMTDQSDQAIKFDEKIDQKTEENQSSESRSSPEIIDASAIETDKIADKMTDKMSDKSSEKPEVVKKSTSLDEALDKLESAKNAAGKKILPKFLQKKFASVEEVGTGK